MIEGATLQLQKNVREGSQTYEESRNDHCRAEMGKVVSRLDASVEFRQCMIAFLELLCIEISDVPAGLALDLLLLSGV
jgi:hypothetical protein